MSDSRHQCRWCVELVTGNGIYCCMLNKTKSEASTKRVNKCKYFDFCEMDAYDISNIYKPRIRHNKQVEGQMNIEF